MEEDTVVGLPRPGGTVEDDPLLCVLRAGARQLLSHAIEAEVAAFLALHADQVDESGRRRLVRHGHAPKRVIQTGIGGIEVQRPRVRDRGAGDAPRIRFTSTVLPAYLRRARNVQELLPWLYLKGISTGQFEAALTVLLGPDAPGLSAATMRRLVSAWQDEHQRWQERDLSAKRYVYVRADGVYFAPRLEHARQCLLVLIGADADGKKELLAIDDGLRASEQSWHELLIRLRDENGLMIDPELATGDGALGFWKAAKKVWPAVRAQPRRRSIVSSPNTRPSTTRPPTAWPRIGRPCSRSTPAPPSTGSTSGAPIRSRAPSPPCVCGPSRPKGCLSRATALAMVFKLAKSAERHWRRLNGSGRLAEIVRGVHFCDGEPVIAAEDQAAA